MITNHSINLPSKKIDAYELLEHLKGSGFTVEVPVDVDKIAEMLDIEIRENPDIQHIGDIGYIKVENGTPVIWLNPYANENEKRRRFTLAHELGHFCLHILPNKKEGMFADTKENLSRNAYWDIKELQANNFAANLLMPVRLIKEEGLKIIQDFQNKYNRKPTVDEFINIMAERFKVSKQAMKYRLINIGAIKG